MPNQSIRELQLSVGKREKVRKQPHATLHLYLVWECGDVNIQFCAMSQKAAHSTLPPWALLLLTLLAGRNVVQCYSMRVLAW